MENDIYFIAKKLGAEIIIDEDYSITDETYGMCMTIHIEPDPEGEITGLTTVTADTPELALRDAVELHRCGFSIHELRFEIYRLDIQDVHDLADRLGVDVEYEEADGVEHGKETYGYCVPVLALDDNGEQYEILESTYADTPAMALREAVTGCGDLPKDRLVFRVSLCIQGDIWTE